MAGDTVTLRIALAQVNPTVGDLAGNAASAQAVVTVLKPKRKTRP